MSSTLVLGSLFKPEKMSPKCRVEFSQLIFLMKYMEVTSKNLKYKQNQTAEKLGCSDSTIKRHANGNKKE